MTADVAAAATELADKPSIAILPFDNLSGDPEQENFYDGITEDIITALSRIRQFVVIARNSSFAYKGKNADVRDVASELGVRYIIEGSVRKAGNRIRLTAELVDGTNGTQLWSERYDRDLEDIFGLQDELTQMIVGAIEPQLGRAEQERAKLKKPGTLDAWDIYQRGMHELHRLTRDSLSAAEATFRTVTESDPGFAAAYAGLAEVHYYNLVFGYTGEPDAVREKALAAARRAVELDQEDANARCALGRAYTASRMFGDAVAQFQTTIEINPSQSLAHYGLGSVHVFKGTPEASLVHLETAIRLSPNDTNLGSFFVRKAQAHLYMQEHEEAVKWARRALGLPNFQWSRYVMLISALGHLGRTGEATKAIEALMQRVPNFSRQYALDFSPWLDDDYFEHLMDGLRKAGLPDAAPAGNAAPPLPDKPSIAVLPFDNLSGDPEQEYFSDGITEDIITALSRIRQFFVIARNTTFTFKGRAVDVQAVASDLGVRYVLEGSVRKSGNRVRITAQLIDGDTGNHIWAEKYDRELEDIFAVQDEITLTVMSEISPEISRQEQARARRKRPDSLNTWDLHQRGLWHLWQGTEADNSASKNFFEQAETSDPDFAPAWAGHSYAHTSAHIRGFHGSTEELKNAHVTAARAVALDGEDAFARWSLGTVLSFMRKHDEAIEELRTSIALNPSFAPAHAQMAGALNFCGRAQEAFVHLDEAERLSPKDPLNWLVPFHRAWANFHLGAFDDALEFARKAERESNAIPWPQAIVAACLAGLDRLDEAKEAGQVLLDEYPNFSLAMAERTSPMDDIRRRNFIDVIRKAGLPET